jgi:hypothetical protein
MIKHTSGSYVGPVGQHLEKRAFTALRSPQIYMNKQFYDFLDIFQNRLWFLGFISVYVNWTATEGL